MSIFHRIVEEKILRAMEAGAFDNLPGKGKPLRLDENPFEPEEQRLANSLLKSNDFTLPWIETWAEIERERAAIRRNLRLANDRLRAAGKTAAWELACSAFAGEIAALNRRVLGYNLTVPAAAFQKPLFNAETELKAAIDE